MKDMNSSFRRRPESNAYLPPGDLALGARSLKSRFSTRKRFLFASLIGMTEGGILISQQEGKQPVRIMDWRTLTARLWLLRHFPLLQVVNLGEAIAQAEQNILGVLAGDGANMAHLPRSVRQVHRDANLRNFPTG